MSVQAGEEGETNAKFTFTKQNEFRMSIGLLPGSKVRSSVEELLVDVFADAKI
jgi:hypothetical protein